jgi:mannose-6-phosphate isomerase class I
MKDRSDFRKTTQHLAPLRHTPTPHGVYDIYPAFPVEKGTILPGFDALASAILASGRSRVIIDGFGGVLWADFSDRLQQALDRMGSQPRFFCVDIALRNEDEIRSLTEPYLGGDDPLFGTRFPGSLRDFFAQEKLRRIVPDSGPGLSILYGCGAALAGWNGLLLYVDVPKNEVQFRSRAGSINNLGLSAPDNPRAMYKRFYFVDWPALNRHRSGLLADIDLFVDAQRPEEPATMSGEEFRRGLGAMARAPFRVRPWFEPGPWGGQWIREKIPGLSGTVPNYAWSFELISPENGIMFRSGDLLLESSFDFLMLYASSGVLGDFTDRFGYEFPIRYDFLDTYRGGNLSLQCHPRPAYIHRNFGECFTQDEAYYILDSRPGAQVYLGFQMTVRPKEFRQELERGFREGRPVEVERHVNTVPARKHDFFLIPNGTIHCSGVNNLVLEISATPYIFTFKMYDWMRMDLDGRPRPINIERAFENLYFERRGRRVREELVSVPRLLRQGPDWQVFHLPTHREHFYDVHRYEFMSSVAGDTGGSCHVLSVVEGDHVEIASGSLAPFSANYAETWIIPAAAGRYILTNKGPYPARVVATFLKPGARPYAPPPGARL